MIFLQYVLPIATVLLLVLFFNGLPNLKTCCLSVEGAPGPLEENSRGCGASRAFGRRDLLVILPLTLIYAAVAFFNLGDTTAPQSFSPMYGRSAVLELKADAVPSLSLIHI